MMRRARLGPSSRYRHNRHKPAGLHEKNHCTGYTVPDGCIQEIRADA